MTIFPFQSHIRSNKIRDAYDVLAQDIADTAVLGATPAGNAEVISTREGESRLRLRLRRMFRDAQHGMVGAAEELHLDPDESVDRAFDGVNWTVDTFGTPVAYDTENKRRGSRSLKTGKIVGSLGPPVFAAGSYIVIYNAAKPDVEFARRIGFWVYVKNESVLEVVNEVRMSIQSGGKQSWRTTDLRVGWNQFRFALRRPHIPAGAMNLAALDGLNLDVVVAPSSAITVPSGDILVDGPSFYGDGPGDVIENTTPDMRVRVVAGTGFFGGGRRALTAQTSPVIPAPTSFGRVDSVVATRAGTHVMMGEEGEVPFPPLHPYEAGVLAWIIHRPGETTILDEDDGVNGYIVQADETAIRHEFPWTDWRRTHPGGRSPDAHTFPDGATSFFSPRHVEEAREIAASKYSVDDRAERELLDSAFLSANTRIERTTHSVLVKRFDLRFANGARKTAADAEVELDEFYDHLDGASLEGFDQPLQFKTAPSLNGYTPAKMYSAHDATPLFFDYPYPQAMVGPPTDILQFTYQTWIVPKRLTDRWILTSPGPLTTYGEGAPYHAGGIDTADGLRVQKKAAEQRLYVEMADGGGVNVWPFPLTWVVNTPVHLAVTFVNRTAKLYVNGIAVAGETPFTVGQAAQGSATTQNEPFFRGLGNSVSDPSYLIGETVFTTRAKTAAEVLADYQAYATGKTPFATRQTILAKVSDFETDETTATFRAVKETNVPTVPRREIVLAETGGKNLNLATVVRGAQREALYDFSGVMIPGLPAPQFDLAINMPEDALLSGSGVVRCSDDEGQAVFIRLNGTLVANGVFEDSEEGTNTYSWSFVDKPVYGGENAFQIDVQVGDVFDSGDEFTLQAREDY